jgi:general stress protein 26
MALPALPEGEEMRVDMKPHSAEAIVRDAAAGTIVPLTGDLSIRLNAVQCRLADAFGKDSPLWHASCSGSTVLMRMIRPDPGPGYIRRSDAIAATAIALAALSRCSWILAIPEDRRNGEEQSPIRSRRMTTPQQLEQELWKGIESDRTMMLGIDGAEDGHLRPMTAQIEDDKGPIWFFAAVDNGIVQALGAQSGRATAAFVSKDHELFASIHGSLRVDTDPAVIDRLWNPFVAAWYEGGKSDPKLRLLRLDAEHAQVWKNGSSLLAGIKMLLGIDPKKDYKDKVAEIDLR